MGKMNNKTKSSNNYKKGAKNNGRFSKNRSSYSEVDTESKSGRGPFPGSDPDYGASGRGRNDVAWYANNAQLLKDTASLAYSQPLGVPFEVDAYPRALYDPNITQESIPGVCALYLVPTPGISKDGSSPINMAARNIYSYVRHANSGHSNYEAPDLMIYLLAMSNVYAYYAWMARVYGVVNLYSQKNRFYPRAIVSAMGVDFDDIMNNIADYRAYINTFAYKAGSLCVPDSMPYMKRMAWLYANLYTDDPTSKAQTYLYAPAGFLKYDAVAEETGGRLTYTPIGHGKEGDNYLTFAQIKEFGDDMLRRILIDEDMNIMSGDILKAFQDKIMKIATIPENFTVLPSFNLEVLSQIQNATILPGAIGDANVSQANQALLYQPTFIGSGYAGKKILNMYKDAPEPGDTMVATRLMTFVKSGIAHSADSTEYAITTCGSEIAYTGKIFYFVRDDEDHVSLKYDTLSTIETFPAGSNIESAIDKMRRIQRVAAFNYHPFVRMMYINTADGEAESAYFNITDFGQYENFTIVSEDDVWKMNQTAFLSMFDVPAMGAWSNKVK